ncbi:hypothetical protein [Shimazuella kribbensis]|uniref:hypothetical protein n=1 Tax=Shimazuella kribbensis TaxID=139808 RepID=UPI0004056012|nr:hypothetical protein [Shimazuella kribbensis]
MNIYESKTSNVELTETLELAKELAEYFVYLCGEGEHYVPLITRLREAKTRSSIIESIYVLLKYGHLHLKLTMKTMNRVKMERLFSFIKKAKANDVLRFHSAITTYIFAFELGKIQEQERYLLQLLSL